MNEKQENPLFSRCSVGKNRWFWVTYRDIDAACNRDVDDSGYAKTAGDAEEQARASIKASFGNVIPRQEPNYFASGVHHRQAIKQRASRMSSATDTKEIKYLYADYTSDWDGHDYSVKHRIIKKTAKRVYVAREPTCSFSSDETFEEDGQIYHDIKTVVLDRHELETEGVASSRRRRSSFYTTPWEARNKPATPQCFDILGLDRGATAEIINAAYRRLAKEHHPDHGGNAADFKKLQRAYEMAMNCVVAG